MREVNLITAGQTMTTYTSRDLMTLKSFLLAAVATLSTFGGAAQAAPTPWTDCAFKHSDQPVQSIDCRFNQLAANWLQVQWADGVNDIFVKVRDGLVKDTRGGLWLVKADVYKGDQMIVFESVSTGSVFVVPEW